MEALYSQARVLSSASSTVSDPGLQDLAEGVNDAIQSISEHVVANIEATILAAAKMGSSRVDVLRFQGGDLHEPSGFPYLSLIKGPRDPDLRALVPETLVERLQSMLAPFTVYHVWHNRSNINRLVVQWEEQLPPRPSLVRVEVRQRKHVLRS